VQRQHVRSGAAPNRLTEVEMPTAVARNSVGKSSLGQIRITMTPIKSVPRPHRRRRCHNPGLQQLPTPHRPIHACAAVPRHRPHRRPRRARSRPHHRSTHPQTDPRLPSPRRQMRKLTRKSAAHVNDVPRHLSTMSRDMKTSPQPVWCFRTSEWGCRHGAVDLLGAKQQRRQCGAGKRRRSGRCGRRSGGRCFGALLAAAAAPGAENADASHGECGC
jgi:hypothetical protein